MKLLLDQSTDSRLLTHLKHLGHDVKRIGSHYPPGLPDQAVLTLAQQKQRILITDDRDFGELVFRLKRPHAGVIFLRLGTYAPLKLKLKLNASPLSSLSMLSSSTNSLSSRKMLFG